MAVPIVDVPLSLFGGTDSELSPSDCPEGVSPDNQDVIFLPGSVISRPGLHRLFAAPPSAASIVYQKTYIQPNDNPLTMFLDANGQMWYEDVTNNPGVPVPLATVAPGVYCQSVTAFGREYFAFSDLLHGQDIPRQFDGLNWDRVSQDGPGTGPSVVDYQPTVNIVTLVANQVVISGCTEDANNVVTVTTAAPHGLLTGQVVLIAGTAVAGYAGVYTVQTVTSATTFTYTCAVSGLAASGLGGAVIMSVVVTTNQPHGLMVGDPVIISGAVVVTGYYPYDNNSSGNGPSYEVIAVNSPTSFTYSISNMLGNAAGIGQNSTAGTVTSGGLISPGNHLCAVSFITRQGYITAPSPPIAWYAAGAKKAQVSGIPIGPSNVVARILLFTAANGTNFFTIPTSRTIVSSIIGATAPTVVQALVIPDNVTTSTIVNFSDNELMASLAVDVDGNNLFQQAVLGPCAGVFSYAGRLAWWGELNKVQNFLNMGFDGGYVTANVPTGWSIVSAGGALTPGISDFGFGWQISGDSSANEIGLIQQSAVQDYFQNPILQPNTAYSFRCWAQPSAANLTGQLIAQFYSASTGYLSRAIIQVWQLNPAGAFTPLIPFTFKTPAVIPSDFVFQICTAGTPAGTNVVIDEMQVVFTEKPYRDNLSRWSYVNNPEAYALDTGDLGPDNDTSAIRAMSMLKNNVLLKTAAGLHEFQDSAAGEPGTWAVAEITRNIGAVSLRGGDAGRFGSGDAAENWDITLSYDGLYLYSGGEILKVSQEYQTWFDQINKTAQQSCWVKNDQTNKRILIGAPMGNATTPNMILVMDYRELTTASQIANNGPVHISLAGKMISSDLTRKWTRWNIPALCGEVIQRPGNIWQMQVSMSYGNLYYFDSAKLTDDDLGQIFPYYQTYFFVNHEMEQALQVGSHRKVYRKVCAFVTGVGYAYLTPLVDSRYNLWPSTSMRQLSADSGPASAQTYDQEWSIWVRGERVAFRVSVAPLPGTTDVQFNLQKLIVTIGKDPVAVFRGGSI